MTKRMLATVGWSAILAAGLAAPLSAHHSFAGYDMSKTISAPATLKEFRWGAPHSMVVLTIKGADGNPRDITLASASPVALARQGFKPRDFKLGDKMEVTWNPSKSGALGGQIKSMKLQDGRKFTEAESGLVGETEFVLGAPGDPGARGGGKGAN
jgi:hypothetical protein